MKMFAAPRLWPLGVVIAALSTACSQIPTAPTPAPTTPPPTANCSYFLGSTALNVAGVGASVTISVTTNSGCAWSVSSSAAFVAVTSASSNSGPGTVSVTVAENFGDARNGTLTIAGQTVAVTQAAGDPLFGNWAGTIVKGSGCPAALPASAQWTGNVRRNPAGTHEFLISIPAALVFNQALTLLVNGNTMSMVVPVDTLYTFNATLASDRRTFSGTFTGGSCSGTWSGTKQ